MHLHQLKWLLVLITLSTLWRITEAAADQNTPTWTALMMAGKRLHNPSYFLKAVALAEQSGADDARIHLSLEAAAFEHRIRAPKLSEALFKRDIAILEKLDVDFPAITCDLYELSRILNQAGRYAESEKLLKRALSIRNKWHDLLSNEPFTAEIIGSLYIAYDGQGKNAQANETYAQMLESVAQLRTEVVRARCLDALRDLFTFYVRGCSLLSRERAEKFLTLGLDLANQAILHFKKPSDRAREMRYAGGLLLDLHEDIKAEQLVRQSLHLADSDPDSMSESGSQDLTLLSAILLKENRLSEVERLQRSYLALWSRLNGISSPEYAHAFTECKYFWINHGHQDLAEKLIRDAAHPKASIDDTISDRSK
jgi:hypothetical protein